MNLPRPVLLPYFTAGWPTPEAFLEAVCGAAEAGCPAFEVGIPFSDPVADGPIIQQTSKQALDQGISWSRALELTSRATRAAGIPAIAMTYCNPVVTRGLSQAMSELASAGVEGLIIPDLTLEEGEPFEQAAEQAGLKLIYLVAPTTPDDRIQELARRTRGFLYLVAVRGVTGARAELPDDLHNLIERAVARSSVPVLVGFGISRPDQASRVCALAHGIIVGSALLQQLQGSTAEDARQRSRRYLSSLSQAMGAALS